jgi:hypothetical protein
MNAEELGRARVSSKWLTAAAICVLMCCDSKAQAPLPIEVQADLLRNRISASARANDLKNALDAINEYKKLRIEVPPPILLVEAKAAHQSGDPLRAFTTLSAYLRSADRTSDGYRNALSIYPEYHVAAEPLLKQAEEKKRQTDRLTAAILTAAKTGDLPGVLALIDDSKKLDVEMPAGVWLVEGKASFEIGDRQRAIVALRRYVELTDPQSPSYEEASSLLRRVQGSAD